MRFEILQVQEHRRVAVPGRPEQRQRNQVSDTAGREQILGREQPVITGQVHLPANRHRLTQQAGAQPPRSLRRHWRGEESPRVHTHPGTRHLQRHRHPERPPRLDVHQRLGQRVLPVEVSGQPPAPVAVQQRINADVRIALQMSSQHIRGQRQVVPLLMRDPALPPAAHRREPALPASTGVLDPGGVDVGARREQRPEERHLRVIGRVFMDRSRRRIEEAGLRRTGRLGLPRAQLQHLQQARVLRPQPRQLRGHSRGNLSHAPHHM